MDFLGKPIGRGNHKAALCTLKGAAHIRKGMVLMCNQGAVRAAEDKDDWSFYPTPESLQHARLSVAESFKTAYYGNNMPNRPTLIT